MSSSGFVVSVGHADGSVEPFVELGTSVEDIDRSGYRVERAKMCPVLF